MASFRLVLAAGCLLLLLQPARASYSSHDLMYVEVEETPQIRWIEPAEQEQHDNDVRRKRTPKSPKIGQVPGLFARIQPDNCKAKLYRLCGVTGKDSDDLFYLECVHTFKPNEISSIENQRQHVTCNFITELMVNENIYKMTKDICGNSIDKVKCQVTSSGSYLTCLIERKEQIADLPCTDYIQRLDWVVNNFKVLNALFVPDCTNDIHKFQCGRIRPYRDVLLGQTLACLQQQINKLEKTSCRKQILRVTEVEADNIKLDRQLHLACLQDHIKFCVNIRPGSGQVYKCLMQHKTDRSISATCQEQLLRREKLIASDYRVSRGLVTACKDDISTYRKNVSDDKDIRLAQILLCLESAVKNGSKVAAECQVEMFYYRKILMEDYRLSQEIVNRCANDIQTLCNNLKVGGATIHCLMEYSRVRKRKARVSVKCQRALEDLIKETDAGEDWRVDPVLREACQSVVDISCSNVQGGNARIIFCLMDKLGTDRMTKSCKNALVQIQYFIARDYKLDPQLYKACKADAVHFCNAQDVWTHDGIQMDAERGPLVLPCLYRYAYHLQKNMTSKRKCSDEIRRVTRQRAVIVDLQPEIEEVCLDDLASFCFYKTTKGEEILCLQDRFDRSVEDNEALIEEVRQRPILWNLVDPDYHKPKKKAAAWEEVGRKLGIFNVNDVKNAWRNLKRKFEKECKFAEAFNSGDGLADIYESPFPFYAAMQFLKDRKPPNQSTGNLQPLFNSPPAANEYSVQNPMPSNAVEQIPNSMPITVGQTPVFFLEAPATQASRRVQNVIDDNNHRQFFETLIPYFRLLPTEKVLRFRNIVQQLLQIYTMKEDKWQQLLTLLEIPEKCLKTFIKEKEGDCVIIECIDLEPPTKKRNIKTEPKTIEVKTEPCDQMDQIPTNQSTNEPLRLYGIPHQLQYNQTLSDEGLQKQSNFAKGSINPFSIVTSGVNGQVRVQAGISGASSENIH